ncbi:MAG: hypothetical protein OXU20_21150 [Myxococcales bacterium]|nr:hypothetical protein [Myxococcales bacterium]MDD9965483.1 hypothetical protein [Myxococcales bacterium]
MQPLRFAPAHDTTPTTTARCLVLMLAIAASPAGGCKRPSPGETKARLARAVQPLCPLWGTQQLASIRLGAACPWPIDSQGKRPCAISHYVGDDAHPRTVRRLSTDDRGRVTRYSDHVSEQVVEAGRFLYEDEATATRVHLFTNRCEDPAPQFVRTDEIALDDGLISTVRAGQRKWTVRYDVSDSWFDPDARVEVSGPAGTLQLHLDSHGNVERRTDPTGTDFATALSVRAGRVATERVPSAFPGRHATARYRYGTTGELIEIAFRAPGGRSQRYVMHYACDQEPACAPGSERQGPMRSGWFAFDPSLERFSPRNCTEQHQRSPRLCDAVAQLSGGLTVECCRAGPGLVALVIDSPMTREPVASMRLEGPGDLNLESATCTRSREASRTAWRCDFPRPAVAALPEGPAQVFVLATSGQALLKVAIETGDFKLSAE